MRMGLNRDQEIYEKIANQNLNQWLKAVKGCASIESRIKLESEKAPKYSAKYFQDKTCKIKQMQNIPVTVKTF